MNKPVCKFKDNKQLNKYLKEWQNKLYLNDWIIKAELASDLCMNGEKCNGLNNMISEHMTSFISISTEQREGNPMMTYCEEKVLVHELLHLKYNWLQGPSNYESEYVDAKEHQLLEQMAKTLILTKYNLDREWFNNINIKEDENNG